MWLHDKGWDIYDHNVMYTEPFGITYGLNKLMFFMALLQNFWVQTGIHTSWILKQIKATGEDMRHVLIRYLEMKWTDINIANEYHCGVSWLSRQEHQSVGFNPGCDTSDTCVTEQET